METRERLTVLKEYMTPEDMKELLKIFEKENPNGVKMKGEVRKKRTECTLNNAGK